MMEIVLKLLSGSGYRECISGGTMDALDVRHNSFFLNFRKYGGIEYFLKNCRAFSVFFVLILLTCKN